MIVTFLFMRIYDIYGAVHAKGHILVKNEFPLQDGTGNLKKKHFEVFGTKNRIINI